MCHIFICKVYSGAERVTLKIWTHILHQIAKKF